LWLFHSTYNLFWTVFVKVQYCDKFQDLLIPRRTHSIIQSKNIYTLNHYPLKYLHAGCEMFKKCCSWKGSSISICFLSNLTTYFFWDRWQQWSGLAPVLEDSQRLVDLHEDTCKMDAPLVQPPSSHLQNQCLHLKNGWVSLLIFLNRWIPIVSIFKYIFLLTLDKTEQYTKLQY
jgi:hypothetical protein